VVTLALAAAVLPGPGTAAQPASAPAATPAARAASAVPAFDVAYRAWDAVTDIARHNRDPAISGECGKTFRPFVIPGLKMQDRQGQDASAAACVAAARAACASTALKRTAGMATKCGEFR